MKIKSIAVALFLVLSACASGLTGRPPLANEGAAAQEKPVGRYQLVTATIEQIVPQPERVVLRIDTETGQVWELSLHSDSSGASVLYWEPIQEKDDQAKQRPAQ